VPLSQALSLFLLTPVWHPKETGRNLLCTLVLPQAFAHLSKSCFLYFLVRSQLTACWNQRFSRLCTFVCLPKTLLAPSSGPFDFFAPTVPFVFLHHQHLNCQPGTLHRKSAPSFRTQCFASQTAPAGHWCRCRFHQIQSLSVSLAFEFLWSANIDLCSK